MPQKKGTNIIYPIGSDHRQLASLQKKAFAIREKNFNASHEAFLRQSKLKSEALNPLVKSLGIDDNIVKEQYADRRKTMRDMLSKEKPVAFKPLQGHNPVRYAPYDMPWSSKTCGGITYCTSYGPNASSGQIGASLGIFNAGGASSVSSVGFWYYAQQEGTLYITAQANVWGRGYVFSGLFGYASAYCGLRVYVERYSSDFTTFSATTDIYNNWGVLEFDIRSINWENRTVSIRVPLRPRTWYAIWTDSVQSAYAGGVADSVSNFMMYVGPVSFFVV